MLPDPVHDAQCVRRPKLHQAVHAVIAAQRPAQLHMGRRVAFGCGLARIEHQFDNGCAFTGPMKLGDETENEYPKRPRLAAPEKPPGFGKNGQWAMQAVRCA